MVGYPDLAYGPTHAREKGDASLSRADGTIDRRTQRKFPDDATISGVYGLGTGIARLTVADELGRTTATPVDAFGRTLRSQPQLGANPVVTTLWLRPLRPPVTRRAARTAISG